VVDSTRHTVATERAPRTEAPSPTRLVAAAPAALHRSRWRAPLALTAQRFHAVASSRESWAARWDSVGSRPCPVVAARTVEPATAATVAPPPTGSSAETRRRTSA